MFQHVNVVLAQSTLTEQKFPPVRDLLTDWRAYAAVFVLLVMLLTASGGRKKPTGFHPADKKRRGTRETRMHKCPRCGNNLIEAVDDKPNNAFNKNLSVFVQCTNCSWHD